MSLICGKLVYCINILYSMIDIPLCNTPSSIYSCAQPFYGGRHVYI